MAWGAAIAAAAQLGSSIYGQVNSGKAMKKQLDAQLLLQQEAARLNYGYTRKLNQTAYQDTTYSMRQSGINPMLAINNGINGLSANVSTGQAQMAVAPNDIDLASAIQLKQESDKIKNDTKRVANETKLNDSTVNKQQYEADLAHEQSANINEQTRQLMTYGELERKQNLINSAKQGALLDAQRQDVQNQMINRNLATNSAIQLNHAQTSSTKEQAIQQQRDNEWYQKHPGWYNFAQGASAVGNVFRGGLSKSFE